MRYLIIYNRIGTGPRSSLLINQTPGPGTYDVEGNGTGPKVIL